MAPKSIVNLKEIWFQDLYGKNTPTTKFLWSKLLHCSTYISGIITLLKNFCEINKKIPARKLLPKRLSQNKCTVIWNEVIIFQFKTHIASANRCQMKSIFISRVFVNEMKHESNKSFFNRNAAWYITRILKWIKICIHEENWQLKRNMTLLW